MPSGGTTSSYATIISPRVGLATVIPQELEPPLPPMHQQVGTNHAAPIADQHDKSPITIVVLNRHRRLTKRAPHNRKELAIAREEFPGEEDGNGWLARMNRLWKLTYLSWRCCQPLLSVRVAVPEADVLLPPTAPRLLLDLGQMWSLPRYMTKSGCEGPDPAMKRCPSPCGCGELTYCKHIDQSIMQSLLPHPILPLYKLQPFDPNQTQAKAILLY
uniref:Uncharacterized protein n=1 Tax=Oryza glumipatula TaxID=40148 RepID=A0A0E0AQK3_9ORYZ